MELVSLKFIGVGLTAFGMLGAAIGVGNIYSSLISSIARNPSAAKQMSTAAFIGAALSEGMGILSFAIALILLFSK
jgi:F-type H+-transporting ATPase subunit c